MNRAKRISYLGDENSYSYAAATELTDGELIAYESMSKVIYAATSGECDGAVLPVENNVEGAVNEVYDALFDSGLYITKQLVLPIRHSLIASVGTSLDGIKRVVSHPQAIAQCRKFLSTLSVPVEAVSSTSAALNMADASTAAIAFRPKAGQTVLAQCIQDSTLNATRFSLLLKRAGNSGKTVSVAFDIKNTPGSLVGVLTEFYNSGVNLTRILSRPHRTGDGKYRFFVDYDFSGSPDEHEALLKRVKSGCTDFRFLGRYDVAVSSNNN